MSRPVDVEEMLDARGVEEITGHRRDGWQENKQ